MSDVTNYKDLLGRYMAASADFVKSIPADVIKESDGASEALSEMTRVTVEMLLLRVRDLR